MSAVRQKQNPAGEPGFVEHQSERAGSNNNSAILSVDLNDTRHFLSVLDAANERFHFRTFPDSGSGAGHNYYGTLDELAVQLQLENGNGRGAFVVVNEGGNKAQDITRVRALFADFDDPAKLKQLPPGALAIDGKAPHMVVESSPGKAHVYWLVDNLSLGQFTTVQKTIAAHYGSDASVSDLPRVMRLPGFIHHKDAPFRTRIIHESGEVPHPAARILAAFPPSAAATPASTSSPTIGGKVVECERHADLLVLTARFARQIHFDGLGEDAALAALKAEAARGRWTRDMADNEIKRALDDALGKCRRGEWKQTHNAPAAPSLTANRRTLTFRRVDELIANPKPAEWLIRHLLERDCLALVFGDPGVGKSFLAIAWAVCTATGTPFAGHQAIPGGVLFIAGEGGNGLGRRFTACARNFGVSLDGAPLFVSTMASAMTDPEAIAELLTIVGEHAVQHGVPALIVVDTVARNFGGGDENSTKDMTAFVAACDALREQTGACMLLVHHSGHADKSRARGSIALKGALDWEYGLLRDPSGVLHLQCTKAKDAEPPAVMAFRLSSFDLGIIDDEGEPVTSAVLTPAAYLGTSTSGKAGRGKNQLKALRLLDEGIADAETRFAAQGLNPDTAYLPLAAWRDACCAAGFARQRFNEVAKKLNEQGLICIDSDRVTRLDPGLAVI
jgi:hypothetical protein